MAWPSKKALSAWNLIISDLVINYSGKNYSVCEWSSSRWDKYSFSDFLPTLRYWVGYWSEADPSILSALSWLVNWETFNGEFRGSLNPRVETLLLDSDIENQLPQDWTHERLYKQPCLQQIVRKYAFIDSNLDSKRRHREMSLEKNMNSWNAFLKSYNYCNIRWELFFLNFLTILIFYI